jgi:hypothetical protein
MSHRDVLDQQLRLQRALTQGRIPVVVDRDIKAQIEERSVSTGYDRALLKAALGVITLAEPVHVGDEIAVMWDAARSAFKPERFDESEPFVPHGFALLPDAVSIDAGYPTIMRAFVWAAFPGGGTWIVGFAHGDEVDQPAPWALTWANAFVGETLDAPVDLEHKVTALKDVQAFWRLGREFIVGTDRAPRAQRREARRAGLRNAEHVTVLRLRRYVPVAAETAADPTNWTCQWIVRGHWRNQWYPSLGEHRQRYVPPYVKGPPDKPLRAPDRAVEFVR